MKDIEQIIKQHRANFDSEEPQNDHFDRFREKLHGHNQNQSKWQWNNLMKIAATVTILMIAGLTTYQLRDFKPQHFSLGQVSPEYKEVENYFKTNINKQLDIIDQLTKSSDIQEQNRIKNDLAGMDQLYKQLEKELRANPKDERIIQAMIEHFQAKNNILRRIVEQLYLVNQQDIPLADILNSKKININQIKIY